MRLRIVVAGSSGFLGTHLTDELVRRGHAVTALIRRPTSAPDESSWDPYAGTIDSAVIEAADVVVNLAGSPTLGNPHSKKWARNLRESRVTTTRVLAEAIAASDRKPAFLAGNAIAWYGDHGDEVLTEESESRGDSFMTQVTREWQDAAGPAVDAGARVCFLRTSPLMDRRSAPLKQLRLLTKLGLATRLGDGQQRMAMISLRDWLGGVSHLAEHDSVSGPVNLCCPETPTNRRVHPGPGRGPGPQGVPGRTEVRDQARRGATCPGGAGLHQPPAGGARGQRLHLPRPRGARRADLRAALRPAPPRRPATCRRPGGT